MQMMQAMPPVVHAQPQYTPVVVPGPAFQQRAPAGPGGDDDGLLIAAPDRLAEVVDAAEGIEAAERALVSAMRNGHDLHSLTTVVEHVAALRRGEPRALGFKV